jgi:cell division control protein 6
MISVVFFMELTLSTLPPSPPASLLLIQARVRALLSSTCNNASSSIAGRDVERTSLLQFFQLCVAKRVR